MTRKKKKPVPALGNDPLAWIKKDPETQSDAEANDISEKKKASVPENTKVAETDKNLKAESETKKPEDDSTSENRNTNSDETPEKFVLNPVLTIEEANVLKEQLMVFPVDAGMITIDGSGVEMVDTAILQLLVSFVIRMKKKSVKVVWSGKSEVLINTARLLDLHKHLGF